MKISNGEVNSLNNIIIKWLLGILAILTFSNFIYRGFTTNDDLEYYLAFHKNHSIWEYSFEYAKSNGRFYFMFMQPIFNIIIPNILPFPISQLLNLTILCSSIIIVSQIVKKIFQHGIFQYLFILITLIFINIKSDNNAIVSYPFYFTLSFFLLSCSLLFYINYLQSKTKKWITLSIIFYSISLLFYENYILYLPLYGFLAIYFNQPTESFIKTLFARKELFFFLGIVFIYIVTYSIFKSTFAISNYDGVTVSNGFDISTIFKTLTNVTRGAYPLYNYFTSPSLYRNISLHNYGHIQNVLNPIINIQTAWLVKALIVGLSTYLIFALIPSDKTKLTKNTKYINITGILLVLILFIYIPQFLISLTVKYQLYASMGMSSYVTTYFSTHPVYLLLTIVFIFIYSKISSDLYKTIYKYVVLVLFSFCSILTDYTNHHASLDLKNIHKHFEAVNLLLKSEELQNIPENSVVIAPELFNNKTNMSYYNCCDYEWSNYFTTMLDKNIEVVKNDSTIKYSDNTTNFYYLGYSKNIRENDQFFTFSRIKRDKNNQLSYTTDTLTLYSYSASKNFSVQVFKENKESASHANSIMVNNQAMVSNTQYFNIHMEYEKKSDFFKPITIHGKNLDSRSIVFYINSFDDNAIIKL